jgi:hypothetical protein
MAGYALKAVITALALMPAMAGAASVTWPPSEATIGSDRPDIIWANDAHDAYEVHICLQNNPNSTPSWDSGQVAGASSITSAMSGPLAPQTWYYAFVRLGNGGVWSPWSTGVRFYVAGKWLDEPYFVGEPVGSQWPQAICHNPDKNEYLVAFPDNIPDNPQTPEDESLKCISYYILDSAGRRTAADKVSILDDSHLDGVREPAFAYNPLGHEYLIVYPGWLNDNTPDLHDELRAQRVDAETGQKIDDSYLLYETPWVRDNRMAYSPTSNVYLVTWEDTSLDNEIFATVISGATGHRISGIIDLTAVEGRGATHPMVRWNSARDEFIVLYQVDASNVGHSWDTFCGRIRASDWAVVGEHLQVTNGTEAEFNTDLAYDADLDRFLVVYETYAAGVSIWGLFLTSQGAVSGSRFAVLNEPWRGGSLWLTWHPSTRDFLVGWLDNDQADYGRRISQVGVPLGERFKISGYTQQVGNGNWQPIPTANTVTHDYLFSWYNSHTDVYTRPYKTFPMLDTTAPAPVTGFAATPDHGQITLSWTNPTTSDFLGTIIRCKTTGYPTGAHDGFPVAVRPKSPGSSDSFVHTGVVRANTYYYAAFAYDAIPNHASAAQASARPLAQADFDSDNDVDQKDFGHLQECFGGSGQPIPSDCDDADLDGSGDVDVDDLGVFIGCVSGASQPPGC